MKVLWLGIVIASAVVLAAFGLRWSMLKPVPPLVLPNPNGYDDFVAAAEIALGTVEASDFQLGAPVTITNRDELRPIVMRDARAFELLREGLRKSCAVPVKFSTNYASKHQHQLAGFKHLAWQKVYEGRLAELEQRTNDAANTFMEVLRFSDEISRGGRVIDHLVAIAIDALAMPNLQRLIPSLSAQTCRDLSAQLEELDAKTEKPKQIIERNRVWISRTFGPRPISQVKRVIETRTLDIYHFKDFEVKWNAQQRRRRVLMIELAARAYALEKENPPASADDLVPAYLKTFPVDPDTATKIVFDFGSKL